MTNLEVFNAYNNALIAGDFEAIFATMSDDIIWHQPGKNKLSGKKVGKKVLGAHLASFGASTGGTFRVLTNWVSDNDDLVAANVTFKAERENGDDLDMNGIDLFKIKDDKIVEVWLFSSDQQDEDGYWDRG